MSTRNSHKMRNTVVLILILVALGAAFFVRFRQMQNVEESASIRSVQEEEGLPVEMVTAKRGDLSEWMTLAGTVEGIVQYPIVSNNSLQVMGIPVKEGDRVEKGDVIVHLADNAPTPMYHSMAQARANYNNTLVEVRRLRNLFAEGAVSQSDLDAAETQLKVQAVQLDNAQGATTLTASEGGIVTSILVSDGEMVSAGKSLAWIADTSEVKVTFSVGSSQALSLETGMQALWTDPEGRTHAGSLTQLDLMADPVSHLLDGEVTFENADGRLMPGLLVSFKVQTHLVPNALLVPTACLVHDGGQDAVWLSDGQATLQPVTVGLRTVDNVEIRAGLKAGDQVVRHGQTMLHEGVKTKIVVAGEGN